ncbi:MAG: TldD/PmbA family protein [Bacteriovoracaceae bacterium]|nr:TldD/PmbA family protein [Bacteriovoracaceae bacterium]
MLLEKDVAGRVIDHALNQGADFAELFVEKNQNGRISILSSKVHEIAGGVDFGIGIRLIYGTKVLYGYTNSTNEEELKRITSLIAANDLKASAGAKSALVNQNIKDIHHASLGLDSDFAMDEKIKFLFEVDKAARATSDKVDQVNSLALQRLQSVEIFNSEGLYTTDNRHYVRAVAQVFAKDGSEQSTGYEGPGALQGWEFINTINAKEFGEKVAKQALIKLTAAECPAGKMPVIIDNGFGGVIFHEACGHLLETTSVAKKASVFWDKLDTMIANECVSAVDDGTIEGQWGSINIDDEGMPTQKTQLIKDGKLTGFLVDKVGSMKTGYERTGSGRRQNYRFAPASRMRNTFIEPGTTSLDEMISTIGNGIYCKKMGGGSVQPGTGEFNFSAQESYLIKDGKIDQPLKSATLIGTGPEVLKQISVVGNNFELAAGMCGSVSGAVPTTVGQAAIKVDEILVGGQGK